MTEARPAIRKQQRWLFQGQRWTVHDILPEGVIVLMGPQQLRNLDAVTAEELYDCGELEAECAPPPGYKRTVQAMAIAARQAEREVAGGKRKGRPPKPKPPASPRAWRCSLLAVDTAKRSGWAHYVHGKLQSYGECTVDDDAELLRLCKLARETTPALLVLESVSGFIYPGRSALTLMGLGRAHEAWHRAWRDAGGLKGRVLNVKPTRWRGALFGRTKRGLLGQKRKAADMELQYSDLTLREHGFPANDNALGPDTRAAICLGRWACFAGELGEAIPSKLRQTA